ncbi:glycerate dehydrogenase [Terasakiispira papahanaumokuakeensis]|uniref:Glycerate dehydrogenase n=1 Tax=Terasakiispira papahanaumokuakeensis TaxID=197479 RepID=A0A1E2VAB5_9GAMM|nr:D-2-hydroxyacid dehydrogenase [Terasakiispira papahanaumokuakeensis]ODC03802.1 glycerate dehydrogenase [Terasakiispira papahanaumokuakeensis]
MSRSVLLDRASMGEGLNFTHLQTIAADLTCYDYTRAEDTADRLADAEIALTNKVVIDEAVMAACPKLKLICVMATGTNNIDLDAAKTRGISVKNVEAYGTHSVAQHTMMLMLALTTQLPRYQQDVAAGKWQQSPFFCLLDHPVMALAGKHLVIQGSGTLGKKVAQLAEAFDMKVTFAARPGDTQDTRPSLASLISQTDVLSLHCPLTDDSRNLVDGDLLAKAKPELLLINCARGGIVDESAALTALKAGQLGGFATDVLTQEPPKDGNPLLDALANQAPLNLIVTPHSAWISREARQNILDLTADNIQAAGLAAQIPS